MELAERGVLSPYDMNETRPGEKYHKEFKIPNKYFYFLRPVILQLWRRVQFPQNIISK